MERGISVAVTHAGCQVLYLICMFDLMTTTAITVICTLMISQKFELAII